MAFPQSFLDELVSRCDIVDVVGSYVQLTRKGANLFGLCPFHSEKTGSFSVAPDKQIYYCFGCKKGGGVVNFIMEEENLTFPDAVRFLAKRAGMEVPEEEGDREERRLSLATGLLAAPYLERMAEQLREKFPRTEVMVCSVKNEFFGEQITVSGLITGQDLVKQLSGRDLAERLLLPCNMLRAEEDVFLDDFTVSQVQSALQVPLNIVKSSGQDLLDAILARNPDAERP